MSQHTVVKCLLAITGVSTLLIGCADPKADNEVIRSQPTAIFKYDHFDYVQNKGGDSAHLVFRNMSTGEYMEWRGGVQDAMVYLESLDKGQCYKYPVDRGHAENVPCG